MSKIPVVVNKVRSAADAQQAYCCMLEAPTPWPEALCSCRDWVAQNLGKYVEGYHLQLASGEVIGHLYYALSERALFPYMVESNVAVIYCEWVQRRFQGQGLGKRLFIAFVQAMRQEGVKGILVEGSDYPADMHYQHYLKRGFEMLHDAGHKKLLYLPLAQPQIEFRALQSQLKPRQSFPVEVVILNGYLCPYEVSTHFLIRQIAQEFGEQVKLREVWLTPEILPEFGTTRGIFINGRQKLYGGEPEEAVRQAILEEL